MNYLVSPHQGGAAVHVVLRLKDVDHFVGVEFEHALHLFLLHGFLPPLTGLLVHLLPALLVLPDPPQVPSRVRDGFSGRSQEKLVKLRKLAFDS